LITRDDGKKMWAYKGRPPNAWKNDKAPGDTDGDGKVNGAWHEASFDSCLHELGRKERKRECQIDLAQGTTFALSQLAGVSD
jgi:hypothetical protein